MSIKRFWRVSSERHRASETSGVSLDLFTSCVRILRTIVAANTPAHKIRPVIMKRLSLGFMFVTNASTKITSSPSNRPVAVTKRHLHGKSNFTLLVAVNYLYRKVRLPKIARQILSWYTRMVPPTECISRYVCGALKVLLNPRVPNPIRSFLRCTPRNSRHTVPAPSRSD